MDTTFTLNSTVLLLTSIYLMIRAFDEGVPTPTSESVQRGSVKAKRKFGEIRKGAGS
jgi:hypothetical protein